MIIDATSYIGMWPYWSNHYADETGGGLVTLMDKANIEKSVVVSTKAIFYDDIEGNELMFSATRQYPDRLLPSIALNPESHEKPEDYLQLCIEKGATILRIYPYYHGYHLTSSNLKLNKLIRAAENYNIPVAIPIRVIMNWGFYALPVAEIISFVNNYPDVIFLIDCFNYGELNSLLELARENNNVFLVTTCFTMMKGIERIMAILGPKRIICGTGAPIQIPECGVVKIQKADIAADYKNEIFGGNILRIITNN